MSDIAVAAVLAGTILLASTVSVEVGLSVALIELFAGVVVGNAFSIDVPSWLSFIGTFAGILLTFLAGAEVDMPQFPSPTSEPSPRSRFSSSSPRSGSSRSSPSRAS